MRPLSKAWAKTPSGKPEPLAFDGFVGLLLCGFLLCGLLAALAIIGDATADGEYGLVVSGTATAAFEDGTVAAQKLLSCAIRTGQRFGAVHVIDVLRGSAYLLKLMLLVGLVQVVITFVDFDFNFHHR